ncbi:MAG: TIGR00300 family protein [bacterium]
MPKANEVIELEGHLIDAGLLSKALDRVVEGEGEFEILDFKIGMRRDETSKARVKISAKNRQALAPILEKIVDLGGRKIEERRASLAACPKDGCAPENFYSTTNHRTFVLLGDKRVEVKNQRMDGVLVVKDEEVVCAKLRDVQKGDLVVVGHDGIVIERDMPIGEHAAFGFMENTVSSERRVELAVKELALDLRERNSRGEKIAVVAGPVVVHTGGTDGLCALIREGYVNVLLAGTALAVHDIEYALFGTSLGMDLRKGVPTREGHKNHMRAINKIRLEGGIEAAVRSGALTSGIFYECAKHQVPYVLAGSIRDDGPLHETEMDLIRAQEAYAQALADVSLVIMLASMLHGIGVGNMLPSWVRTVCVDINPAVVTKLADRGTSQVAGLVTDVGLFLTLLARELTA